MTGAPCSISPMLRSSFSTTSSQKRLSIPESDWSQPMHRKFSTIILILSCLPAAAQDGGPRLQQLVQGKAVTIVGRAHVQRGAEGTFIEIENPGLSRQIAGFISFGDEPTFPGL